MLTFGSVCSGIEAARRCPACGTTKPASAFHRQGKAGRHTYCADCYNAKYRGANRRPITSEARRAQNIRSRYGLSPDDVAAMLAAQGGDRPDTRYGFTRSALDFLTGDYEALDE